MARIIVLSESTPRADCELACENRGKLDRHGVFVTSLAGASGSGNTSLLERTIPLLLNEQYRVGVVAGDVATDRDARRMAALDVPVVQIITNGTCHIEARMISDAVHRMDLAHLDLLFVENVKNLICPASSSLERISRVVIMSVTEGEDKPLKYPATSRRSHGLVITKTESSRQPRPLERGCESGRIGSCARSGVPKCHGANRLEAVGSAARRRVGGRVELRRHA